MAVTASKLMSGRSTRVLRALANGFRIQEIALVEELERDPTVNFAS